MKFEEALSVAQADMLQGRVLKSSISSGLTDLVERLGTDWFSALLRPLLLTFPDNPIELQLHVAHREPMPIGSTALEVHPDEAVSLINISGDASLKTVRRLVSIPSADVLDEVSAFRFVNADGGLRRRIGDLYTFLYRKTPLALDLWRQSTNDRRGWDTSLDDEEKVDAPPKRFETTGESTPTAWFALHWLEAGGAESWAFESIRLAKDAGYEIVITVDQAAPQRMLSKALELSDHVYLGANALSLDDWKRFLPALVATHNFQLLHIHHSARAYEFLPVLKQLVPDVVVIDSTHIIEHRTGGFVRMSLLHSEFIDLHHLISPQLRDEYLLSNEIPPEKVLYAPLTQMEQQEINNDQIVLRDAGEPLRIGFLGRLAAQKRPFLFVELVRRLNKKYPGRFVFVMQGSGALVNFVDEQIKDFGLEDVIERREWGPVDEFFDSIDVLLVTSDNEGLTLTALEADAHQVLVASADVGSQITVVAPEVLFPRYPIGFLTAATTALSELAVNPDAYRHALEHQRDLHNRLRQLESASSYFTRFYAQQFSKVLP